MRAAHTVHGPGRKRAAATNREIAPTVTRTVTTCSRENIPGSSACDRDASGELAHLVQTVRDEREATLQAPVEGGAREVEALHDHLVAADLLHVIVEEQAARLRVARLR